MNVARLRLAPVGETMFPPRAPFFRDRLNPRAAEIAAGAEERNRGNLPVSPEPLPHVAFHATCSGARLSTSRSRRTTPRKNVMPSSAQATIVAQRFAGWVE